MTRIEPTVLEMIFEFPSTIPVSAGAAGRQYQTKLGGRHVSLILPSFRWRSRLERYVALPPKIRAVRPDVEWAEYLHTPWPWGSVSRWHGGLPRKIIQADVSHAVIAATLPRRASRAMAEEIANAISADSHSWWLLLKDWLEVLTPHMLDGFEPSMNKALGANTRAWAWDGERGRSVPIQPSITVYSSSAPAVSRRVIEHACARAAAGHHVPVMHTFLRNARVALWQGRHRAAVLEASTAAELALRELFDARVRGLDGPIADALQSNAREMGRLVQLLRKLERVPLPQGIESDLLQVRNRAIHRGEEPVASEAQAAVSVAATLVKQVSPTSSLMP